MTPIDQRARELLAKHTDGDSENGSDENLVSIAEALAAITEALERPAMDEDEALLRARIDQYRDKVPVGVRVAVGRTERLIEAALAWHKPLPREDDDVVEQAVQAALDAGVAVDGERGVAAARVAAARVAARFVLERLKTETSNAR